MCMAGCITWVLESLLSTRDIRMDATIAICTWNRSDLLEKTLIQMQQLVVPKGTSWEIVVVNNRCTDNTDEILAKYAGALPLRRVFEDKQGQSHARNAAAV